MASVSEKDFMAAVRQLAELFGWKVFHPLRMRGSSPGWPDLVLCRGRRLIFRELKTGRGKLTTDQRAWIAALREAGQDGRPTDRRA